LTACVTGLALLGALGVVAVGASSATPRTVRSANAQKGFSIAFANATVGNTWHQTLIEGVSLVAKEARKDGIVTKWGTAVANNSPTDQANQIRSFIVQHYNAILLDATSSTALNGAIQEACNAHILVIAVDATVTAPCAYNVTENWPVDGIVETQFMAKVLHGHGNLIEIRGTAGTTPDEYMHQGIMSVLKKYPKMHIVGTVYADWTDTEAQQKIATLLPSLPTVNGVVDQGGDGAGAALAFEGAHLTVPPIIMGNRGNELRMWKQLVAKNPKYQSMSISSMPGIGTVAFWTIVALLRGVKHVPHTLYFPLMQITKGTLNAWIAATPVNRVATPFLTYAQTVKLIAADNKSGWGKTPGYFVALPTNLPIP